MGLFSRGSKEISEKGDKPILIEVHNGILKVEDHTSVLLCHIIGVKVTFTLMIYNDHRYKVWLYTSSGGEICAVDLNVLVYHNAKSLAYDLKGRIESLIERLNSRDGE